MAQLYIKSLHSCHTKTVLATDAVDPGTKDGVFNSKSQPLPQ